jgi:hypothetical protein
MGKETSRTTPSGVGCGGAVGVGVGGTGVGVGNRPKSEVRAGATVAVRVAVAMAVADGRNAGRRVGVSGAPPPGNDGGAVAVTVAVRAAGKFCCSGAAA